MARKVGVVVAIIRGGGKTNFNISMPEALIAASGFLNAMQSPEPYLLHFCFIHHA